MTENQNGEKNAGGFFTLFSHLDNLWKYPAGCMLGRGRGTSKMYDAQMSDGKYFLPEDKEYFWRGKGQDEILFCSP